MDVRRARELQNCSNRWSSPDRRVASARIESPLASVPKIHREGTKNAKIIYINLVLRALRVFAVQNNVRCPFVAELARLCYTPRPEPPLAAQKEIYPCACWRPASTT